MNKLSVPMIFSPQNCSLDVLDGNLTANRREVADQLIATPPHTGLDEHQLAALGKLADRVLAEL